jgi:hypothetical protein
MLGEATECKESLNSMPEIVPLLIVAKARNEGV